MESRAVFGAAVVKWFNEKKDTSPATKEPLNFMIDDERILCCVWKKKRNLGD
jgi:hypothetical protein